ncbi:tautomerase family protein [Paenibacillus solanacearum]
MSQQGRSLERKKLFYRNLADTLHEQLHIRHEDIS